MRLRLKPVCTGVVYTWTFCTYHTRRLEVWIFNLGVVKSLLLHIFEANDFLVFPGYWVALVPQHLPTPPQAYWLLPCCSNHMSHIRHEPFPIGLWGSKRLNIRPLQCTAQLCLQIIDLGNANYRIIERTHLEFSTDAGPGGVVRPYVPALCRLSCFACSWRSN